MQPEIDKSSRHPKITGDFAEGLVLYWLFKHGFECARVDHTGIDLIANNPHTSERMGISVKARSRSTGTEETYIKINRSDVEKVQKRALHLAALHTLQSLSTPEQLSAASSLRWTTLLS